MGFVFVFVECWFQCGLCCLINFCSSGQWHHMAPTLLKPGRHGVIPSALNTLLMASKPRASGGHAPGTRTRATGYKGKSGWSEYNRKLVAASNVTVHDVATKRLQVSTKQNQ